MHKLRERIMKKDAHSKQKIDIGIKDADRSKIAGGLANLLADSYTLYIKTHAFHWNVTGPMFADIHELTERQYTELAGAIDVIAERIRALGFYSPGSGSQFAKLTSVKEETGVPTAEKMLKQLVEGQEAVVKTARKGLPLADKANDQSTADLLATRMSVHEKNAWMLRSLL